MNFVMNHCNINVKDIEKSLAFYKKAFGLQEVRSVKPEDGSFELHFLEDSNHFFRLELTWLRDKEGSYNLGDNESHIGFVVDDFEAAHKLHEEMGCICYENPIMGIYFIVDPDGYWQEVVPTR